MEEAVRITNQARTVPQDHTLLLKDLTALHPDHQHRQEAVIVVVGDHLDQEAAVEGHLVANIGGNKK